MEKEIPEELTDRAYEILAEACQVSTETVKNYVDDPNAVLKLEYCLEAIIKALIDGYH